MIHAAEGLFDNAFVTTWTRGQIAEVFWASGAKHRGGYAYRLCKVPDGGISKITEQCFEDGHLDFSRDFLTQINGKLLMLSGQRLEQTQLDLNGLKSLYQNMKP